MATDINTSSRTTIGADSPDATDRQFVRNIMLTLAYDGTDYRGWQVQPNGPSVQDAVESAVRKLTGEQTRVYCAGRTDSGVHAIGQAANFQTSSKVPIENIRRGLQNFLPADITVVSACEVSREFHATYSAVWKRYQYLICDSDVCPPFLNRFVHRCRFHLDVDLMSAALPFLRGTHDFRCFETEFPNKSSSIRTIQQATIQRIPVWHPWTADHLWKPEYGRPYSAVDAPFLLFDIVADGFLYNMVRAIVGTLMEIGRKKYPPESMVSIIQSMDRSRAGITAPAEGLFLVHVEYPAELLIPSSPDASPGQLTR